MNRTFEEVYDLIIENGIASEETLNCVTSINGASIETLNSVIYWATAYNNIDEYLGLDDEEDEEE